MEEKVKAIKEAPAPTNVTQLRSFLGLTNYYNKSLPILAANLTLASTLFSTSINGGSGMTSSKLPSNMPKTHCSQTLSLPTMTQPSLWSWHATRQIMVSGLSCHTLLMVVKKGPSHTSPEPSRQRRNNTLSWRRRPWPSFLQWRSFIATLLPHPQTVYHWIHTSPWKPCLVRPAESRMWLPQESLNGQFFSWHIGTPSDTNQGSSSDALSRLPRPVFTSNDCVPADIVAVVDYISSSAVNDQVIKE